MEEMCVIFYVKEFNFVLFSILPAVFNVCIPFCLVL